MLFSFPLLLFKQCLSALALELFQAEENILLLTHRGCLTFDLEYINVFMPMANAYIYCLLNLQCLNTTSISLSHTAEVPPCTNILFIFHIVYRNQTKVLTQGEVSGFYETFKKPVQLYNDSKLLMGLFFFVLFCV